MNVTILLNSITTVFAWVPAGVLLFLALFGVANVVVNWHLVSIPMFIATCLVAIGASLGFFALTAVCWQFKVSKPWQARGLGLGVFTLVVVLLAGAGSQHEMLRLKLNWVEFYLFVGPLLLGLFHLYLLNKK